MANIDKQLTKHIAQLANIPIQDDEAKNLTKAFVETLNVVNELQELAVEDVEPSHQVTGLVNVFREDTVNEARMFSQKQALANAPKHYNGYFVVPRILEK